MQKTKYVKQPVAVNVTIGPDGQVRPKKFMWKDGNWHPRRLEDAGSDIPLW